MHPLARDERIKAAVIADPPAWFFTADWRPLTDAKEPGYVGAAGTKTYNTHLHLLEAFTALYRAWPDPLVRQRLAELLVINTDTVRHPDYPFNVDGWRPDWRMIETPAKRAAAAAALTSARHWLDAASASGNNIPNCGL